MAPPETRDTAFTEALALLPPSYFVNDYRCGSCFACAVCMHDATCGAMPVTPVGVEPGTFSFHLPCSHLPRLHLPLTPSHHGMLDTVTITRWQPPHSICALSQLVTVPPQTSSWCTVWWPRRPDYCTVLLAWLPYCLMIDGLPPAATGSPQVPCWIQAIKAPHAHSWACLRARCVRLGL